MQALAMTGAQSRSGAQRHDRCAVVLSHRLNRITLATFAAALKGMGETHDVVLVLTEPLEEEVAVAGLGDQCVILSADDIFLLEYGAKARSRRVVPGNPDLVMLAVARARPGYAHYWLIEYDVLMPEGFGSLATLCRASTADLIGVRLRAFAVNPEWGHWRTLVSPSGPVPEDERRAALLSLSRFSDTLLARLDAAYRLGWRGHHEVAAPSIGHAHGLALQDLNQAAQSALGHPIADAMSFRVKDCRAVHPRLAHHPVKTEEEAAAILQALGVSDASGSFLEGFARRAERHQESPAGSAQVTGERRVADSDARTLAFAEAAGAMEEATACLALLRLHTSRQTAADRLGRDLQATETALNDLARMLGVDRIDPEPAQRLDVAAAAMLRQQARDGDARPWDAVAVGHAMLARSMLRRAERWLARGAGGSSLPDAERVALALNNAGMAVARLAEAGGNAGAQATDRLPE